MKLLTILALAPLLAITIGCSITTKVDSVVDKTNTHKINNILIITNGPSGKLLDKFTEQFSKNLSQSQITYEFNRMPEEKIVKLSLDDSQKENSIANTVARSNKPFTMVCSMTKIKTANDVCFNCEMEFFIYSKERNKVIWKSVATGQVVGQLMPWSESSMMKDMSDKILSKLLTDDLF